MNKPHDPYAALRVADFRFYLTGNLIAALGLQMQAVAIGWELYERTGKAIALGMVGLAQILPILALTLPAGHVADRFDRKRVILIGELVIALCAFGLALISARRGDIRWMYCFLFLNGAARAFVFPARSSLVPTLVPKEIFANAVTWSSGGFQLASMIGPALGGAMIGVLKGATQVYIANALAALTFLGLVALIVGQPHVPSAKAVTFKSLVAGFHYVWQKKIILASITLDMIAVLLGGATTLLPIYAKDILHVGPVGLGWLLASPSIGAFLTALVLTRLPPFKQAGKTLLWAVVGFGLATIVFGVSRVLWLSLATLFLTGAFDNISVVIRMTLVQLLTPDDMRGRVSAVNSVFIGTSNELGGFESGAVAALFGPVVSVVSGGIGTLVVVLAVALIWPQIRQFGRLDGGAEKL